MEAETGHYKSDLVKLHCPAEPHTRTFAGLWGNSLTDNSQSVLGKASVFVWCCYEGTEKIQTTGRDANRK